MPALTDLTLSAIQAEATRAHLRHAEHSMLSPSYTSGQRLAILAEEVGEAQDEALMLWEQSVIGLTGGPVDHRERAVIELVQAAAMAASWRQFLAYGAPPAGVGPVLSAGTLEAVARGAAVTVFGGELLGVPPGNRPRPDPIMLWASAALGRSLGRVAHELTYDAGGPGVGEGRPDVLSGELAMHAALAALAVEYLEGDRPPIARIAPRPHV